MLPIELEKVERRRTMIHNGWKLRKSPGLYNWQDRSEQSTVVFVPPQIRFLTGVKILRRWWLNTAYLTKILLYEQVLFFWLKQYQNPSC